MERKTTKAIVALMSAVMMCANVFAQSKSDSDLVRKQGCDDLLKKTSCIFEGKFVSSKEFTGTDGRNYISNVFEVTNIIKGDIQKGTVEIISTPIPKNSRDFHSPVYSGTTLNFCTDAGVAEKNSGVSTTNAKSLRICDATAFSANKITQHFPLGVFNYFSSVSEFYTYLQKNYGITIDKSLLQKKSPNTGNKVNTTAKPYTEWEKDVQKRKHSSVKRTTAYGCTELYISEYLDGQGDNNAVEIYNPTAASISLSNYKLLLYHSASYTPVTIALTGTIIAYGTHVVAQQGASSSITTHANQTTGNLNFNGNVCTVLSKGTTHIDKIGIIGVANPSGTWTLTPSGGTNNSDIRRKYNISLGDTSWTNCKTEWDVFSEDSVSNLGQHANICGVDPDLNITFANPQVVGSNFEFDVMLSSTGSDTYLDNVPIEFTYNSTAFGTHAVANNRVTVTLGSAFTAAPHTGTYSNPQIGMGDGVDSLELSFGTNTSASSWDRVLITSTPVQALHFSFQIQNCNNPANIHLINNFFVANFSWYYAGEYDDPTNLGNPQLSYDNVNYGSDLTTNIACSTGITITDFPSPINAGIGNTLTILGSGFGSTRGNGQVKFTDADNGGATYLQALNANDYISWSNTQIRINLPSIVDSLSPNPNESLRYFVGGNNFIVKNNAGDSAVSALNSSGKAFDIYFSLSGFRNVGTHNKNRVNLRSSDTSGGYVLRLNPTDFPVGSGQRIAYTKAVGDWRCMTGANIRIGADTTITNYIDTVSDGVNYVFFKADPSFLGYTLPRPQYCSTDMTALYEGDMTFSTVYTFSYDTNETHSIPAGQYDFYAVALHELGHFLGLEHIVDVPDLMYYQESNAGISAANRKKLIGTGTSPVDGVDYNINHSISTLSGGGSCWIAMVLGQCSSPFNGIEKYTIGNLHLFPNPTSESITIQGASSLGTISVYNTIGQLITQRTTKENTAEIDLSSQAAGIYLVKVGSSYIKVIKQ